MEYSQHSHYRWGWGADWFNAPDVSKSFHAQLGSCQRSHKGFRTEVIHAAQLLTAQFTKPTMVGLSGGFDSQVVCLTLLELKYKFTPLVLRLVDSNNKLLNGHDIDGAIEFCKRYNLKPKFETLDMLAFYRGRGRGLVVEHALTNVQTVIQLHVIDKFCQDYSFIMGGGDLMLLKPKNWRQGNDVINISLGPTPIQQHLIKYGYEGCTKFFMYTPELIASYLDNQVTKAFFAAQTTIYDTFTRHYPQPQWWLCFNYYIKPMFYVEAWPELIQRKKFTGFEAFPEMQQVRDELAEAVKPYDIERKSIYVNVQEIIAHLLSGGGATKEWRSRG